MLIKQGNISKNFLKISASGRLTSWLVTIRIGSEFDTPNTNPPRHKEEDLN